MLSTARKYRKDSQAFSPSNSFSLSTEGYIGLVVVLALALLFFQLPAFKVTSWLGLALCLVTAVGLEFGAAPLSENKEDKWSTGILWGTSCAVIFGPAGAVAGAIGIAAGGWFRSRWAFPRLLFNFFMFLAMFLVSCTLFQVLNRGGNGWLLVASLTAGVGAVLTNEVLIGGVIAVSGKNFSHFVGTLWKRLQNAVFIFGTGFIVLAGWVLYQDLGLLGLVTLLASVGGVQWFIFTMGQRIFAEQKRMKEEAETKAMLSKRALDASNNERSRIASALHDGPVQDLSVVIARLKTRAEGGGVEAQALNRAAVTVEEVVQNLRDLMREIAPKDLYETGLELALTELGYEVLAGKSRITVKVGEGCDRVPGAKMVFRVVQEALRNVAKHAQAKIVSVRVERSDRFLLVEVEDDGRGFTLATKAQKLEEGHMGMSLTKGLVENDGGTLKVVSGPGVGTLVQAEIPVE